MASCDRQMCVLILVLLILHRCYFSFFFFNDTATTEIYTLSLHDALPIWRWPPRSSGTPSSRRWPACRRRSEEHTSELQSQSNLVCRLLLEKKKTKKYKAQWLVD